MASSTFTGCNIESLILQMFVELDELNIQKHDDYMWQERARWIKFEEDFEEGSHRWGKPHVACLSFHSLLELRKCLEDGEFLGIGQLVVLQTYIKGNFRENFSC